MKTCEVGKRLLGAYRPARGRPAGQSSPGGASATLLYNVVGRRISAAGVSPLPDIYEQPRHMVDLSLRLPVRGGASVRVDARNLLDARYRFRQGPIVVEQFRVGRTVSAGFTWRR